MLKVDLHTHTIASGHAFNTINEMATEAARKGVEILGITDHGPNIPDGASRDYFYCGAERLPREINGVKIMFGIEANIKNRAGELDIAEEVQEKLDIVIAGLHNYPGYENLGRAGNTEAIINAMKNPYVKIISHPYSFRNGLDVDIEKITEAACSEDVLLEINSSYFYINTKLNTKIYDRIKRMVKILKKHNRRMIINSDAHNYSEIGRDEEVREKFDYLGLTDSDILNYDLEAVKTYFNIK